MKLKKWVQVLLLIITIASMVYGLYAFARIENSIEIDIFHSIAFILDIPFVFLLTLVLESDYCTIFNELECKLAKLFGE